MNWQNARPRANRIEAANYNPKRAESRAAAQLWHRVQRGDGFDVAVSDWLTLACSRNVQVGSEPELFLSHHDVRFVLLTRHPPAPKTIVHMNQPPAMH